MCARRPRSTRISASCRLATLKIAPTDSFNIEVGKLPTLIGAEYTFTFENMNIERGLLWKQEPAVSRGVQANYTSGPVTASASVNDGAYSNRYNWVSGSLAYTISPSDTVIRGRRRISRQGRLSFGREQRVRLQSDLDPYVRSVDDHALRAIHQHSSVRLLPGIFDLGRRSARELFHRSQLESQRSRGIYRSEQGYDPMLYGHKSSAWSFTITPTYQYKIFFARAEASMSRRTISASCRAWVLRDLVSERAARSPTSSACCSKPEYCFERTKSEHISAPLT